MTIVRTIRRRQHRPTNIFVRTLESFVVTASSLVSSIVSNSNAITPEVYLEYVDTSGDRQRTLVNNDGSTSIAIDQYQGILVDATGTRGTHTDVDDEAGAWFNMGYRIHWGESLGTNWSYPVTLGYSMDEDFNQPLWGRVFTTTGSKTVRLRCKDPAGNQRTIQFTVVVNSLGTPTHITAGTSWPTWTTNTVYTVDRGSDYTSMGEIRIDPGGGTTTKRHRIVIMATGSGAAPILPAFVPDGRNEMTAGVERTANVRVVNCDVARFEVSYNGFDFCGVINGRCRTVKADSGIGISFNDGVKGARGSGRTNNLRYPRGFIVWNAGEINNGAPGTEPYCIIGTAYGAIIQGNDLHRNAGSGEEHVLRAYFNKSSVRYNRLRSSDACKSYLKGSCMSYRGDTFPMPEWPSHDRAGDYDEATTYYSTYGDTGDEDVWLAAGYVIKNFAFARNQYGHSSENVPRSVSGMGPQNTSAITAHPRGGDHCYELIAFSSLEEDVHYGTNTHTETECEIRGYHLGARGERESLGAGAVIFTSEGTTATKVPSGYNGPFYSEDDLSRPVPDAF